MSFFDDKQEILKVELTTYGRYLISRGKFKPAYYAFFDDDVIYDGKYADLEETQNSIQTRILDESIFLKPQTTFTSLQNNIKVNTLLAREEGKLKQEEAQISADKNYALSLPLANSAINSDYVPSWSLRVVQGQISSSTQFIDNTDGTLDILQQFLKHPQIELEKSIYDIKLNKNEFYTQENYNQIYTYISGNDQYNYSMKEAPIILDLKEMNVEDLSKNFNVEIFIEEQEIIPGTDQTKTILRKLNFKKEPVSIVNGILLDEPITYKTEEDNTYVEYYFETTVDGEIELPPQQKAILPITSGSQSGPYGVDC